MTDPREERLAAVQRDLARWAALDEIGRLAPREKRYVSGASVVFSVRLDPREVQALENRAAVVEIKPSVLARNLIRSGLAAPHGETIAAALDRVEAALAELRAAVT